MVPARPAAGTPFFNSDVMPTVVRKATPLDLDWLVSELKEFSQSYPTRYRLFGDEDYVRRLCLTVIVEHVFFIAEKDGKKTGFIAGWLAPHPFNPQVRCLDELAWWVKPEFRKTNAASLLIDAYTDFGKENADWVTFGLHCDTPIKPSSIIRKGYNFHERAFLLEVI